ncbi:MAG: Snf7 family protein [Candidatus Heimdallarchaeota archaeon]
MTGKKPRESTQTVAELRQAIKQFNIRGNALKRMANEEDQLVNQMLSDGNRKGAGQALKRRQGYMKQLNMTYGKIATLEKLIDTIRTTQDNVTMQSVLTQADREIQRSLKIASPEQTEEIMVSLEESVEQAAFVDEALGSASLTEIGMDVDELDSIEEQLAKREAALASETSTQVAAPATTTTPSGDVATSTPPAKEAKDEELQAEVEKMKKELEKDLKS